MILKKLPRRPVGAGLPCPLPIDRPPVLNFPLLGEIARPYNHAPTFFPSLLSAFRFNIPHACEKELTRFFGNTLLVQRNEVLL